MSSAALSRNTVRQAKVDLPIRHMEFKFDPAQADVQFFRNTSMASAYFEALSIFLTFGEDLVIDTARYHRQFLTDPELKRRVTALIGQEAIHSKMHLEWNGVLAQHRFPVPLYSFLADQVFEYGFKKLPNRMQLSLMAGIEHFTAVLAEHMMKNEYIFYESSDERQRALWMWHMLEESEHKDIAYDVYQTLSGNYALRISGFSLAAFTILFLIPLATALIPVLRTPRDLLKISFWKDVKYSIGFLAGRKEGVWGSTLPHLLDYLRRDFHPNDHDTSAYLEYFKEKLLHPENGLLTPYLVKEFYPPKRA